MASCAQTDQPRANPTLPTHPTLPNHLIHHRINRIARQIMRTIRPQRLHCMRDRQRELIHRRPPHLARGPDPPGGLEVRADVGAVVVEPANPLVLARRASGEGEEDVCAVAISIAAVAITATVTGALGGAGGDGAE